MTKLSPLQAHENVLKDIFSDRYAFEIPAYQRAYAWTVTECRELLSDLLEAMDAQGSDGDYFLGSIVLVKAPSSPVASVIDGQQRLTTLTLLLSVIRDGSQDSKQRAARGAYIYQKGNPDERTEDKVRLTPRRKDRAFFQKYIQNDGATSNLPDWSELQGSQQRFIENATFFRDELAKLDGNRRDALTRFLISGTYLVSVEVASEEAARRIFIVLNARGMDLSATDILKADLLQRIENDEDIYAERWDAVETALGREEFASLFGIMRMIHEREKPRMAMEKAFPKFVQPFASDPLNFIDDHLEPAADALQLLSRRDRLVARFGSKAAEAVVALGKLDNGDWRAPAILKILKCKDNASTAKFLIELECVAYHMFVARWDVTNRINRYVGILDEIDPRADVSKRQGIELSADDKKEFLRELDGPLYTKTRVVRPLLERLDSILSSGGATYSVISVEHVLPQTVSDGSEWATLFPDIDERRYWVHRLANLVLLTKRINTKASNWDFGRKISEYFASSDGSAPFPLTQGVLNASGWNAQHLATRQINLIQKLSDHWGLDYHHPVAPQ